MSANLSKCVTCGGTISENAKVCPHCGETRPVGHTTARTWYFAFLLLLILVLGIYAAAR